MAAGVPCCLRDGVRFCISFSYTALSISAVTTATERAPSVKHCPSKGMSGVKAFCANVCSVRTQCMPSGGFGTCCSCVSQCGLQSILNHQLYHPHFGRKRVHRSVWYRHSFRYSMPRPDCAAKHPASRSALVVSNHAAPDAHGAVLRAWRTIAASACRTSAAVRG